MHSNTLCALVVFFTRLRYAFCAVWPAPPVLHDYDNAKRERDVDLRLDRQHERLLVEEEVLVVPPVAVRVRHERRAVVRVAQVEAPVDLESISPLTSIAGVCPSSVVSVWRVRPSSAGHTYTRYVGRSVTSFFTTVATHRPSAACMRHSARIDTIFLLSTATTFPAGA